MKGGICMKKIMAVILTIALLLPAFAIADVDLTGMTYEQLVELKNQINLAIWASEEWQEVSVPSGVYIVGEDIPAGKWTLQAAEGIYASVKWGDTLAASGVDLDYGDLYEYEALYSPTYKYYEEGRDKTEVTYDMKDGQYVIVDDGMVVFTPYSGKPSLGFK